MNIDHGIFFKSKNLLFTFPINAKKMPEAKHRKGREISKVADDNLAFQYSAFL